MKVNIEYKPLFLPKYHNFKDNISLMRTMAYEELYFLLNGSNAPYDGYSSDGVLSPRSKHHNEYFRKYKLNAIQLLAQWKIELLPYLDNAGKGKLDHIDNDMIDAKDFVDLTWAATGLLESVYAYKTMLRESV